MSIDMMYKLIGVLVILLLVVYGRKEYWRGRATPLHCVGA